jgi:hypothetical protein
MTIALLNEFYQSVQSNLKISPAGSFTNNRELQRSVTREKWEESRSVLNRLKAQPIVCSADDFEKLTHFINSANGVGLMCGFIKGEDVMDKDRSRSFDKSGLELHIKF